MKQLYIFITVLLQFLFALTSISQTRFRAWSVLAGGISEDYAFDIVETTNGGFVILGASTSSTGAFSSNHGGVDILVAAYNSSGQQLWMKLLGGTQNDVGTSIVRKANGSLYIAGRSKSSDFDFASNIGAYDYFLMKLDANGNIIWVKNYGGTDEDIGTHLIELSDGFLLTGISMSNDSLAGPICYGFADYWLVKTDTIGNVLWTKRTGGSDWERYPTSTLMSNGKIFTLGSTSSFDYDVTVNYGPEDFWLNQFAANTGSLLAQLSIGGPISEIAADVVEDNAGNYYVCGSTTSTSNIQANNHGGLDLYITKFSAAGARLWSKCFGGVNNDYLSDIKYKNGSLYLCGTTDSNDGDINNYYGAEDIWLLELDTAGAIKSNYSFGRDNTDEGLKVLITSANEIIIVASTLSGNLDSTPPAGVNDILLIKLGLSPAALSTENLRPISLVPNPSSGIFYLQNWNGSRHEITDFTGKQVLDGNTAKIDIRHLQAGIYFLHTNNNSYKLVKTND